jgi:hypothetical protein
MNDFSDDLKALVDKYGLHSLVAAFSVADEDGNCRKHHLGMLTGGCGYANTQGARRLVERLEEVNPEPPRRRKH